MTNSCTCGASCNSDNMGGCITPIATPTLKFSILCYMGMETANFAEFRCVSMYMHVYNRVTMRPLYTLILYTRYPPRIILL